MSAIKLKGKVPVNDDSWAFRFMLNKQQACADFKKYYPDKVLTDLSRFKIAERNIPDVCALWAMFPAEERLLILQTIDKGGSNIPYLWDIRRELTKGILMQPDMTPAESAIMIQWVEYLHPMFINALLHYVLKNQPEEYILNYLQKNNPHDAVVSYILLNGSPELQTRARETIAERNLGNSLQVLQFAITSGRISKDDNEIETFVNHFRNNRIHTESIRLLKKYKTQVTEALTKDDAIFEFHGKGSSQSEARALALNLFYRKSPQDALEIMKRLHVYRWDIEFLAMVGPAIYQLEDLKTKYTENLVQMTSSYYSYTKKELKQKISFFVKAPMAWKEELKARLVLNGHYHQANRSQTFDNVLLTHLGLDNLRTKDANVAMLTDILSDTALKIPNAKEQLETLKTLNMGGEHYYDFIIKYNDADAHYDTEEEMELFI